MNENEKKKTLHVLYRGCTSLVRKRKKEKKDFYLLLVRKKILAYIIKWGKKYERKVEDCK